MLSVLLFAIIGAPFTSLPYDSLVTRLIRPLVEMRCLEVEDCSDYDLFRRFSENDPSRSTLYLDSTCADISRTIGGVDGITPWFWHGLYHYCDHYTKNLSNFVWGALSESNRIGGWVGDSLSEWSWGWEVIRRRNPLYFERVLSENRNALGLSVHRRDCRTDTVRACKIFIAVQDTLKQWFPTTKTYKVKERNSGLILCPSIFRIGKRFLAYNDNVRRNLDVAEGMGVFGKSSVLNLRNVAYINDFKDGLSSCVDRAFQCEYVQKRVVANRNRVLDLRMLGDIEWAALLHDVSYLERRIRDLTRNDAVIDDVTKLQGMLRFLRVVDTSGLSFYDSLLFTSMALAVQPAKQTTPRILMPAYLAYILFDDDRLRDWKFQDQIMSFSKLSRSEQVDCFRNEVAGKRDKPCLDPFKASQKALDVARKFGFVVMKCDSLGGTCGAR